MTSDSLHAVLRRATPVESRRQLGERRSVTPDDLLPDRWALVADLAERDRLTARALARYRTWTLRRTQQSCTCRHSYDGHLHYRSGLDCSSTGCLCSQYSADHGRP